MNEDISKIRLLIDKINSLGFFDRLFGWKKFKKELPGIAAGLTNVNNELEKLQFRKEELSGQLLESSGELRNVLKEKTRLEGVELRLSQNVSTKDCNIQRNLHQILQHTNSKKHMMGSIINAASLGRVGIGIAYCDCNVKRPDC